jgi:hypothetical protein
VTLPGASLADILPAVGAHLGVPGCADDPLGLPDARRYVVWLVDGLGWELLLRHLPDAPTFAGLMADAQELSTVVPSTTAAAVTSLGTGLLPGRHGLVGYRFWDPALGQHVGPLKWETTALPEAYQPSPTLLDRAAAAGVNVTRVVPRDHVDSGFSRAALRGPAAVGVAEDDAVAWAAAVARAAGAGSRSLVYTYDRSLDHAGHADGVAGQRWLDAYRRLDRSLRRLLGALPPDTVLLVTGDHGMLDVPADHRVRIEVEPALAAGLDHVGGEARFRHLYTREPDAVATRWRDVLGDRADIVTKAEAIDAGWFGPVGEAARGRLGDVIAAARDDWAVLTRRMPVEAKLVGMHGSLTRAELAIPLCTAWGGDVE